MWEFILAVVFATQVIGMGLLVRYVALQPQRKTSIPSWLRWTGQVIGPVGILAGLGPVLGGFWLIGVLGYSSMVVWWFMLVAHRVVSARKDRAHSFLSESRV